VQIEHYAIFAQLLEKEHDRAVKKINPIVESEKWGLIHGIFSVFINKQHTTRSSHAADRGILFLGYAVSSS
jgi:hypothetical protein